MGYLTINTRSNRVVIISSVITRIFFNSVQCLDGHISTCFNKDTRDLFMLCIMLVCQIHRVVFYYCCSIFIQVLFVFCFIRFFCFFIVHCSREKIFNSDPGLYSRYFDSAVPLYKKYHHHLCKSINIIHQTAPTLSKYRSEGPITIIDIPGYTKPIFSKS
jgi:hypothetical protein